MNFFWNRNTKQFNKNYPDIISQLEIGELQTIEGLLWQPDDGRIDYLPIVFEMIAKFKKPLSSNQNLTVYKALDKGNYQLIIFEVPWLDKEIKYSPIIFDKITSKVVGIMLPFNELSNYLSARQHSDIGKLGIEWTGFILSKQFEI